MYKEIKKYIFFDGEENFQVINSYDDWLSSSEYRIYTQSYIKVGNDIINLFGPNRKKIHDFFVNNLDLFNELNRELSFVIEVNENNKQIIYDGKNRFETYYVIDSKSNGKNYVIFYALGGSRFVESITIYKVFVSEINLT